MFKLFIIFFFSSNLIAAPLIINGETADIRDYPWQVSIQNRDGHICGGSIISKRFIITAAHCIKAEIKIYGGGDGNVWRTRLLGKIKKSYRHELWEKTRRLSDIALIEMEDDIKFSDDVKSIKLVSDKDFKKAKTGIVTGFGVVVDPNINREIRFPRDLQKAELKLGPTFNDSLFWSRRLNNYYSEKYDEYKNTAFADVPNRKFDERIGPCYADSGGPLVIQNKKGEFFLAGVVSKLIDACGIATIFTYIPTHLEWISIHKSAK